MTLYPWESIDEARIAGKQSMTENLVKAFWKRSECVGSFPVSTLLPPVATSSTSYPGTGEQKRIMIPSFISSPEGTFRFQLAIQIKNSLSGTTGQFRYKFGSGGWAESSVITFGAVNTYENLTIEMPHATFMAAVSAGGEATLEVSSKRVAGSGSVTFQDVGAASRIEHHQ